MQSVELKNLNLSILPESAQQEMIDFYQFLIEKYVKKQKESLFIKPTLKGVFNQYADTSKTALENSAWEKHLLNKHRYD